MECGRQADVWGVQREGGASLGEGAASTGQRVHRGTFPFNELLVQHENETLPGLANLPGDSAETENCLIACGIHWGPYQSLIMPLCWFFPLCFYLGLQSILPFYLRFVHQVLPCLPAESDSTDFWMKCAMQGPIKRTQWPTSNQSETDGNKVQAHKSCKTVSINKNTKKKWPLVFVQLHTPTTRLRHNTNPEESLQLFNIEWKLICCHDGSWS